MHTQSGPSPTEPPTEPMPVAAIPLHRATLIERDALVVTASKEAQDAYQLKKVIALLEQMDVLKNRKLCLQLVATLAERVGYQCAGYAGTITVAELMLMSARASELAERVEQMDHN
ncbi:MAG: hypothetical protein ACRBB0_26165 [Pelagimonas sp.]|uniref:hypothetical protein n=1 Tax=Pelagimonas sp. TaxID=2073170 RepID=UPI003D6C1D44